MMSSARSKGLSFTLPILRIQEMGIERENFSSGWEDDKIGRKEGEKWMTLEVEARK